MELDLVQTRILGCLVEKEATTPDNYPLSTNALLNACNQSSNRDPVVSFDERTVTEAMLELRSEGLARTVRGGRTDKHKHVLDEAWALTPGEQAIIAVLFLRGPQTVGELRGRTDRIHEFDDLDTVEATLRSLAERDEPFTVQMERLPGQKERRWAQLLSGAPDFTSMANGATDPSSTPSRAPATAPGRPAAASPSAAPDAVASLKAELTQLRAEVDHLYQLLGERPPAPADTNTPDTSNPPHESRDV